MQRKTIISSIICFLLMGLNGSGQCNGTLVSLFPANVNGVTVTETYTGSVSYATSYTICNIASGPMILGGGTSTSFVQKLTFSSPVNNILYILNASDSGSACQEIFTFSVDLGVLSAAQAGTTCLYRQSGNTFYSFVYGAPSNGAYITLTSTQPYNSITISGPGGCNGSFMALCSSSIGVESFLSRDQVSIYPNPSMNGKFTVDYALSDETEFEIYDLSGILVNKYRLNPAESKIEISQDLISGIYIYKMARNNSLLKSGKIVIIK